MDHAEMVATVLARDVLRREAQLPPLDIEFEIEKARRDEAGRIVGKQYLTLCETYGKERQDIRAAIIHEAREKGDPGYPSGWSGHYGLSVEIEKRFAAFLAEVTGHHRKA